MSKKNRHAPLLEWAETARQSKAPAPGTMDIEKALKAALAEDIRHAHDEQGRELSRAEVAARMTDLLGVEITLSMLNNWTAPTHPHGIPAKYLPSFTRATGGRRAYEALCPPAGLFVLPGEGALRAEIQELSEEEKNIRSRRKDLESLLKRVKRNG